MEGTDRTRAASGCSFRHTQVAVHCVAKADGGGACDQAPAGWGRHIVSHCGAPLYWRAPKPKMPERYANRPATGEYPLDESTVGTLVPTFRWRQFTETAARLFVRTPRSAYRLTWRGGS